jgi:molybdate transport system substrate-binding protein
MVVVAHACRTHDEEKSMPRKIEAVTRFVGLLMAMAALSAASTAPSTLAQSDEDGLTIAVAANFTRAMEAIERRFEAATERPVTLVIASTGTLYAQIANGAPIDIFFAADAERPRRLEQEGLVVDGSRFTYAIGRSILWSAEADAVDPDGDVLASGDVRQIAIANPRLAPYGEAARQVMTARGVWEELQPKLVFAQNVNQAHQFVASGNAELGFIALSQVIDPATGEIGGSHWLPPQAMYDPVRQQAVVLQRTERRPLAASFVDFVQSEEVAEIIRTFGYAVAGEDPPSD